MKHSPKWNILIILKQRANQYAHGNAVAARVSCRERLSDGNADGDHSGSSKLDFQVSGRNEEHCKVKYAGKFKRLFLFDDYN